LRTVTVPDGAPRGRRPVDSPRRPVPFINPSSGGGTAARVELSEKAGVLGIPCVGLEPGGDGSTAIMAAFTEGVERRIDIGEVNGHVLLSNVAAPGRPRMDGEPVTLDPPLHFASRPGALRGRVSRRHPGAPATAKIDSVSRLVRVHPNRMTTAHPRRDHAQVVWRRGWKQR
jgi:hypothetical protein